MGLLTWYDFIGGLAAKLAKLVCWAAKLAKLVGLVAKLAKYVFRAANFAVKLNVWR